MPKEFTPGSVGAAMQEEAKTIVAKIEAMQQLRQQDEEPEEDARYTEAKQEAQQSFARLLIYHQGSFNGYTSDLDTPLPGFTKRETNQKAEQMAKSEDIEKMFAADNLSNVKSMILDGNNELRPVDEMVKNIQKEVKEKSNLQTGQKDNTPVPTPQPQVVSGQSPTHGFDKFVDSLDGGKEAALRETRAETVQKLRGTLSKSFTGRLKSFFVGNSKQYNEAFNALDEVVNGKGDKYTAERKIKDYLTLRGGKVRDHEYGRDRFDLMMQGLATLMEPKKFAEFCGSIDADRNRLSNGAYGKKGGKIEPAQYLNADQIVELNRQPKQPEAVKDNPETQQLEAFLST